MAGSGMGRQVKFEGKRSKREGGVCVCRTVDWHLSLTWSHVSDLSTYVEREVRG